MIDPARLMLPIGTRLPAISGLIAAAILRAVRSAMRQADAIASIAADGAFDGVLSPLDVIDT